MGDKIFNNSPFIVALRKRNPNAPQGDHQVRRKENNIGSSGRVAVEWSFGGVVQKYPLQTRSCVMKIQCSAVLKLHGCAFLLYQMNVLLRACGPHSPHFSCFPVDLETWFYSRAL